MRQHNTKADQFHVGRAGWFAIGVLAASIAFVAMLVAGDFFSAMSSEDEVKAEPPVVIEGN
jgi:hypothetical protein